MGMVIVNPGIYTTVQDEGRFGYEQFGVSPAGPMDRRSFHIANLLVGNDMGEAELEMTIMGAEIQFTGPAVIALTGADMSPLLNEAPVCMYRAFPVGAGDVLRMQSVSGGCRTSLAAAGGLDIPVVMGSRSTLVKNGIGGYQGRPLKKGDAIGLRQNMSTIENLPARWMLAEHSETGCRQIRVVAGPQDDCFTGKGLENFFHGTYKVTGDSDRMGYRLTGPCPEHVADGNIISDGIVMGSIQVPTSGQPIVMMADCQSIGGYTKIATVITADLPVIGQCKAGDEIRFTPVDIMQAQQAYADYFREMEMLKAKFETPVAYRPPRLFQVKVGGTSFQVKVEEHS